MPGDPTNWGKGVLQNSYPQGNITEVDPARRYLLGRFLFDHSHSVAGPTVAGESCGGAETPLDVRFVPRRTTWLDLEGREYEFQTGQWQVGVNGGDSWCCHPDPVAPVTWRAIKAQYR